ncbi:MAG: acyltransferase domain-containing protein, partial [Acidobacteriales bacterium]|nr:acyltransferase domain-containing protein [Terriglobales bacterium]
MSHAQVRAADIAIVGMSGRFPGARNVDEFWQNLCNGVHSVSRFSEEEMIAAGTDRSRIAQRNFVNAGGVLDDIDLFDAGFFGFNPREAETLDPQQRVFLECAWEALESAGCDPERFEGAIGVFSGCVMSTYLFNVLSHPGILDSVGAFQVFTGNDKDHLATRVSYKLNLKGPSIAVQTACSTSLVAVSMACQSLVDRQCDMALAGGVAIRVPQKAGYTYQEGMIYSREGCCRPFDARADGTVFANGVGIVVLKRLDDALRDRDNVQAVIRGWALNNDGATKVGYTAPSLEGQMEVIALAHAVADVEPETVTHVEAHGTGTSLGDPIEIAALTQAFRIGTGKTAFAAISSVKSNVGHLDVAAGVTGLIKAALELKHKLLVPSLHFEKPNSNIDFAASPFYVNTALAEWRSAHGPRRAGVSSFGIGGTNAHVVLEEAPQSEPAVSARSAQLLLLSAKTPSALNAATANLAAHLRAHPDLQLADGAFTLQCGRRAFDHRRAVVCHQSEQAAQLLEEPDKNRSLHSIDAPRERPVVFLFPGQGTQQVGMARHIYENEQSFRDDVDLCAEIVHHSLGEDLRSVLYPAAGQELQAQELLNETVRAQPALFIVEYAFARLWMKWGILPAAMLGHSVGEYVAACLAGVFTLEDALSIITQRGRLVQQMPRGAMLAISLPEPDVARFIGGELDIAAMNDPDSCVVSGSADAVQRLEHTLQSEGISCQRLSTSHAFHSRMMDPMLAEFGKYVSSKTCAAPTVPYVLNVTAQWADMRQPPSPSYWQQHVRQAVRFSTGLEQIYQNSPAILLEVGPGETLTRLARRHPGRTSQHVVLASQPSAGSAAHGWDYMLGSLGNLWVLGQTVDWDGFHAPERPRRVSLPSYPFERQSYWVERAGATSLAQPEKREERLDISDWCLLPYWQPTAPAPQLPEAMHKSRWLIFADSCGLAAELTKLLGQHEQTCVLIEVGERFQQLAPDRYRLDPRRAENYLRLLRRLSDDNLLPQNVVHLWSVTREQGDANALASFQNAQVLGLHSLLHLTQAWNEASDGGALRIFAVSSEMHTVLEADGVHPEKATLLGACRVIPQEDARITCSSIDIAFGSHHSLPGLAAVILREMATESRDELVAIRNGRRWVQSFQR